MGKSSIIIVFALIFGFIIYGQSLRKIMLMSDTQVSRTYGVTQAQNIAQSSAMIAVSKIRDESDNTLIPTAGAIINIPDASTFSPWDDLSGEYRLRIQNLGDTLLTVESSGRFDTNEYTVTVLMNRGAGSWNPDLMYAVFSDSTIVLEGSAAVYGNTGTNAVTEDVVKFTGNPRIHGSLAVGPNTDPEDVFDAPTWMEPSGWVTDGLVNLDQPLEYELPPFPEFPPQTNPGTNIELSGGSDPPPLLGSQLNNVFLPEINIQSDRTLTIDTQGQDLNLFVGNLNVQQGHINFTGGGSVTLMVDNNITLNGSSTINSNSGSGEMFTYYKGSSALNFAGATNFNSSLYAETADITLTASGGIQGNVITGGTNVNISGNAESLSRAVYAPNAFVDLAGSGRIRGAVVASTFKMSGNARVFFEEDFDHEFPEFPSEDGGFAILSWQ